MIEHPITTQRANTYGAALEAETQTVRALSDAMACVCEGLLAMAQSHRPQPAEQQQIQTPDGRHNS
jgi:hypothetical protein